jgi:hypothetical protein
VEEVDEDPILKSDYLEKSEDDSSGENSSSSQEKESYPT